MNTNTFADITTIDLERVTGGGWKGKAAKWIGKKAGDAKAYVSLRAEEFGKLPIDKKASTLAAFSGAISAPVAAGATVYNAFKK